MRLVTFEHQRDTRIGALMDRDGQSCVLDLCQVEPQLPADMIGLLAGGEQTLAMARSATASAPADAWLPEDEVTLLAPVPRPGKIICMGHNYHDHSGLSVGELPEYPTFFSKYANTVIGPGRAIVLPRISKMVDNEAELAVVIGKRARHITEKQAPEIVAGYTIFNDVSARDIVKRTSQWMLGKTFDTFGPMGPALVTGDEIPDPASLELSLTVNGQELQHSNTRRFIFSIPFLLSYLSQVMTLEPGDLLSTGTPARLGDFRENPIYMKPGDEVRVQIEKIGELRNTFVADV